MKLKPAAPRFVEGFGDLDCGGPWDNQVANLLKPVRPPRAILASFSGIGSRRLYSTVISFFSSLFLSAFCLMRWTAEVIPARRSSHDATETLSPVTDPRHGCRGSEQNTLDFPLGLGVSLTGASPASSDLKCCWKIDSHSSSAEDLWKNLGIRGASYFGCKCFLSLIFKGRGSNGFLMFFFVLEYTKNHFFEKL